jgi:CPA2 family monovalent cation:H+ antiporter-2
VLGERERERERELAMTGYALRGLGLGEGEARLYVQGSRGVGEAWTARGRAPELRPHRTRDGAETEERPRRAAEVSG